MTGLVMTALGLVVSMTVGVGFAGAHGKSLNPIDTTTTTDLLSAPEARDDADRGEAELEGTLEVLVADQEDGNTVSHHVLSTHDGKRVSLQAVQHPDLLTGDVVRVKGARYGQTPQGQVKSAERLEALPYAPVASTLGQQTLVVEKLEVLQYAPLANTLGPQKVVVLLVNFSNDQSQPLTVSEMTQWMMTYNADFFRENSYGQTSVSADVFGWYTIPMTNAGCPTSTIKSYADQAATAAGVNLSAYARRVYYFPHTWECSFSGLATGAGNPSSAWINGSVGVITHELGHNFGLSHSHSMSCAPAILSASGCTTFEYGDEGDTMGSYVGPFNAFQKVRLGWLGFGVSPPITEVTQSGTYHLDGYSSLSTSPKALKIQRGATYQAFFVELRTPCSGCLGPGIYIRLATDGAGNSSYLLDMSPATPIRSGANLAVGQSFTDPVSGITIKTVSESDTSATIEVNLGGTGPSCTRSAPSVTASPAQGPLVQPGSAVTYTVSVANRDSAGCPASSFALQATVPSGWLKSFATPSLAINPAGTMVTTLQITSPIVPAGSYTIVGTATSSTASTLNGSASMVYNVVTSGPGPSQPGMFTDTFGRPDAPVMDNGWSMVAGTLSLLSGEARTPMVGGLNLAVRPELMGAAQTVSMSFASTNNNTAPRFGGVLRYQDPKNYYICYRQVGGSSTVRVAKVRNGVETVLKSVGVPNPALNAFSTLSCQASGSTLTMQLDGVTKVSVTDATFATGNAGYSISSKTGGSHRADSFSANIQ